MQSVPLLLIIAMFPLAGCRLFSSPPKDDESDARTTE